MPAPSNPITPVILIITSWPPAPGPAPQGYPPGLMPPHLKKPASNRWRPQRLFSHLWWYAYYARRGQLPLSKTTPTRYDDLRLVKIQTRPLLTRKSNFSNFNTVGSIFRDLSICVSCTTVGLMLTKLEWFLFSEVLHHKSKFTLNLL